MYECFKVDYAYIVGGPRKVDGPLLKMELRSEVDESRICDKRRN